MTQTSTSQPSPVATVPLDTSWDIRLPWARSACPLPPSMASPSLRRPAPGLYLLQPDPGQTEAAEEGEEPGHGAKDKEEESEKGCAPTVDRALCSDQLSLAGTNPR